MKAVFNKRAIIKQLAILGDYATYMWVFSLKVHRSWRHDTVIMLQILWEQSLFLFYNLIPIKMRVNMESKWFIMKTSFLFLHFPSPFILLNMITWD